MSSNAARYDYDNFLVRLNRSMETGEPSVVDTPEFHNDKLLQQAWKVSPYNKGDKNIIPKGKTRDIMVHNAMCFQPRSGYCGLATVNTVLASLDTPLHVRYPQQGRGYSMVSLAEWIILQCTPHPFINVQVIYMEPRTTLQDFRDFLYKYANAPNHRLLANFHRTPLFYSERSTWEEARHRAYAGHWSPVGGIIHHKNKDYVLVLDTNDKYGPFMVSLERFYNAVKTQTLQDGYRGFIHVEINNPSNQQQQDTNSNPHSTELNRAE